MKEQIPSRTNYDLADFSGRKAIDTNFHCTLPSKKKLAKTSKTGLKLDQKLLLIPSPERTGYRKSYLAGRLNCTNSFFSYPLTCAAPSWVLVDLCDYKGYYNLAIAWDPC